MIKWWADEEKVKLKLPSTLYKRDADLHVTWRALCNQQTKETQHSHWGGILKLGRLRSGLFQLLTALNANYFVVSNTLQQLIINNVWPWKRWQGK